MRCSGRKTRRRRSRCRSRPSLAGAVPSAARPWPSARRAATIRQLAARTRVQGELKLFGVAPVRDFERDAALPSRTRCDLCGSGEPATAFAFAEYRCVGLLVGTVDERRAVRGPVVVLRLANVLHRDLDADDPFVAGWSVELSHLHRVDDIK